ncbi:MAG: glycine--tRNA ligase subunit beta [Candidatus Sulfobium sp.]|jgi:glycyl-tRNA synthetase beta chain
MEKTESTAAVLLEIGTEEIPSRFLPGVLSDLNNLAGGVFDEYRIAFTDVSTFATPRRLSLIVKGVAARQSDVTKEVFGPSKKAAFDENGLPTRAAEGFARSVGVKASGLVIRSKGKGEYVAAVIEEKGLDTGLLLPELLKKIILSLRFPKSMRWGDGTLYFARPIHWILSVFGTETVRFDVDGIKSGNITRGHRFLSPASFQVKDAVSYMNILANNYVILDQDKRRDLIQKGIDSLAAAAGGLPIIDNELLDRVTFLVEFPVPVLCGFSTEYLKLPKELLITVMRDHQKYFAVHDDEGNLVNSFVVVSNTRADNAETVRTGAERVIRARFDDAKFYFHEDRKRPLSGRVEELKQVTFHDRLGSLFEKTGRVTAIAAFLSAKIGPSLKDSLERASLLSKTDLLTGVVREFPELQGIMGKYYALHDREDEEVAAALEEQYLPGSFGGKMPETELGAFLSLSDKADNIASFFAIGLVPSGSEDPFALRRQALGIVSILLEKGYPLSLREMFADALTHLGHRGSEKDPLESIIGFMEQRIEFVFSSKGNAQDVIKSVLYLSSILPLKNVSERIDALKSFKEDPQFPDFLLAVKRIHNIVPKGKVLPPVREELFVQDEEKDLFAALLAAKAEVSSLMAGERFSDALKRLSEITAQVNSFFDKVLVMDKEEKTKENRLSLLKELWDTAYSLADFSKLLQL